MTEIVAPFVGIIQFTSVSFLLFLAITAIVYYLLPGARSRTALLLAASSTFYVLLAPRSFGILLSVTAVAYLAGLLLARLGDEQTRLRRGVLIGSVVLLIGDLVVFKYFDFIVQAGNRAVSVAGISGSIPLVRLALPLGISFWTFQTVAYVVDVYKGKAKSESNPFYFWLSVMFFPVVTAGPITKIQSLTTQLREKHRFDYSGMQSGLLLIGRGFFKKLLIADRLAVFVDNVFSHPRAYSWSTNGLTLFIAAAFFAIQLYMDFSGYTDIVRGAARLFGVELPINFRAPYFARNVREFWRRWHITLMAWLREYVYIPLGGNRRGRSRRYLNLMVVFAISGLWHGTGVTFLVWGLLNGFYLIAGEILEPANHRLMKALHIERSTFGHRVFQTILTFVLITTAWVFFRANTISDALFMVSRMFSPSLWVLSDGSLLKLGLSAAELAIAIIAAAVIFVLEWISLRKDLLVALRHQPLLYRWVAYYGLILVIVIFGAYGGVYNALDFVYFKF